MVRLEPETCKMGDLRLLGVIWMAAVHCVHYQFKYHKPMKSEFALDLSLARKKAGLTQRDTAHLLAISTTRLSHLEAGLQLPGIVEICTLSLIYGRSFESLFGSIMADAKAALRDRILSLPNDVRRYVGTRNREHSIDRLARSLAAEDLNNGA
jgi:transcriptional regulator with XRE-family HTH domain